MSEKEKLLELIRLHDEAFARWMEIDGHCKSSDGAIELHYGTVHDRRAGLEPGTIAGVSVYAYVVGPSRHHYFDSLDQALGEMRKWHREAMEYDESEAIA